MGFLLYLVFGAVVGWVATLGEVSLESFVVSVLGAIGFVWLLDRLNR